MSVADNLELVGAIMKLSLCVDLLEQRLALLESSWRKACELRRWPDELDRPAGNGCTHVEPRRVWIDGREMCESCFQEAVEKSRLNGGAR